MAVHKSAVIYSIALAFGLVVIEPSISAQKKGGGAAASTSSGSSASASGQGASAAATAPASSNAPFEVETLSYGALDQIFDKVATYPCGLRPAPGGYGQYVRLNRNLGFWTQAQLSDAE